jgi:hypothetical protein
LKKENAAWKDLHKTCLASEQKHKAMINDLLHENLKLKTIMSNSTGDLQQPAGRPLKVLNLVRSLLPEEVEKEKGATTRQAWILM